MLTTLNIARLAFYAVPVKPRDDIEEGNEISVLQIDQYYTVTLIGKHRSVNGIF